MIKEMLVSEHGIYRVLENGKEGLRITLVDYNNKESAEIFISFSSLKRILSECREEGIL